MNEKRTRISAAIADAIYAINAESSYIAGKSSSDEFAAVAGKYIECGHAFDNGGDYVCPHCIGNEIADAILGL